jgi:hypothetical protein
LAVQIELELPKHLIIGTEGVIHNYFVHDGFHMIALIWAWLSSEP